MSQKGCAHFFVLYNEFAQGVDMLNGFIFGEGDIAKAFIVMDGLFFGVRLR